MALNVVERMIVLKRKYLKSKIAVLRIDKRGSFFVMHIELELVFLRDNVHCVFVKNQMNSNLKTSNF